MKQIIDQTQVDIDSVSVDSWQVRERLADDDKYGIDQVPAVVVLYSTGQHKVYTQHHLDQWFEQLLINIQQLTAPASQYEPEVSMLDSGGEFGGGGGGGGMGGIGLDLAGSGMDTSLSAGMDSEGLTGAQRSMITGHIRGPDPPSNFDDPNIQPGRKEVKKEGISAAELAKQYAQQREQYEEQLEENRPFI